MAWTIGGWVVLAIGAGLGFWALAWDRSHGRRRCPGCWYDMGAVAPNERGRWVCPECGRSVERERSLRRTRRRWRWAWAALVVLVGGHTILRMPRVLSTGWTNVVPTWAMVLCVPLLDNTEGTAGSPGVPIRERSVEDQISWAVKTRLYERSRAWMFDRWLFVRVSMLEDPGSLTDQSSVRGDLYAYVFDAMGRQGRMSFGEERWARSVYLMEIETRELWPQIAQVHAHVKFRRLMRDRPARVRIHKKVYEVRGTSRNDQELRPLGLRHGEWWDGTVRLADFVRWPNHLSPIHTEDIVVRGQVFEGDSVADLWWPVGEVSETVGVTIAETRLSYGDFTAVESTQGVELVEDVEQTRAWIEASIEADVRVSGTGRPRLTLSMRENASQDQPSFTFGGDIAVVLRPEGADERTEGFLYPFSADGAWWALRDQLDEEGKRVFENGWKRIVLPEDADGDPWLWGEDGDDTLGRVNTGCVRITIANGRVGAGGFASWWDLEAQRIFPEMIEIELDPYDIRQIKDYLRGER